MNAARQPGFPGGSAAELPTPRFAPGSAERLLVIGGILLIAAGLVFGEIFAVFTLHPNAGRIGDHLLGATRAVAAGDSTAVAGDFTRVGGLLENRGTKVDAHVHIIAFGYLALLLALLQPCIALDEGWRRASARLFLAGAAVLPIGVLLIHYLGLQYSPLTSIGWASIAADLGGALVIASVAVMSWGLWRHLQSGRATPSLDNALRDGGCSRALLAGGTLLILTGFLYGAWYAGFDLYRLEAKDGALLRNMALSAAAGNLPSAEDAVAAYNRMQGEKAVKIAAHSHIIEFGLLALLLAFLQPYVFLSERWRRRCVGLLLVGSVILPVFVLLEVRLGLVAGGIADCGGLLVVLALLGMLAGVLRHTGRLDAGDAAS